MSKHPGFRFLDDIATADAVFEASGSDLPELFAVCAQAMFSAITDIATISRTVRREVTLESGEPDSLLFDWLAELVYLKDVHRELYSQFEVTIEQNDGYRLAAVVSGEEIDPQRHQTRTDVKAVTYHRLKVEKTADGYQAFVVLDL